MAQILIVVIEQVEGKVAVRYEGSDGLAPAVALAALRAVEGEMQEAAIVEEVKRRLNVERANVETCERENVVGQ